MAININDLDNYSSPRGASLLSGNETVLDNLRELSEEELQTSGGGKKGGGSTVVVTGGFYGPPSRQFGYGYGGPTVVVTGGGGKKGGGSTIVVTGGGYGGGPIVVGGNH